MMHDFALTDRYVVLLDLPVTFNLAAISAGLELPTSGTRRTQPCRGLYLQAMFAAARGDDATTRMLTDQMTRRKVPGRVGAVLWLVAQARTLSALTRGDFEAAY